MAVLALVVMAGGLIVVPRTPVWAAPGDSCDADGDGDTDGREEAWTTNGDDSTARRLAEDAGLDPGPSGDGYRWKVPVCVETDADDEVVEVLGPAEEVLATLAPLWEAQALDAALADVVAKAWRPGVRIAPGVDTMQVVGLETWLAIDPGVWVPVEGAGSSGEVSVQAVATPAATVWEFSDRTVRCDGPGEEYTPGAEGPAPCGREWEHTTAVESMAMEVWIEYDVVWTSTIGGSGDLTRDGGSIGEIELDVGEIQSVGSLGDDPHLQDPGLVDGPVDGPVPDCTLMMLTRGDCGNEIPDLGSKPPPEGDGGDDEGSGCAFTFKGTLNCLKSGAEVVVDAGEQLYDWSTDAVAYLGEQMLRLLGPLGNVIAGCGEFIGDTVTGLWDTVMTAKEALDDPEAFFAEQYETLTTLLAAIEDDPQAFAVEFLGDMAELDLLAEQPDVWIGKMGCELAFALLTGGAGASTGRIGRITNKIDDIQDWLLRRNRHNGPDAPDVDRPRDRDGDDRDRDGDDDDPDFVSCPINSFPTGTLVLMADGSLLPIQLVDPGDEVLAADPGAGTWQPRTVRAQWSAVDQGEMATITLTDGSAVSATDHHRFWVDSTGAWVDAEDLQPGDLLLTPDGVTTAASVELAPPAETLVWELTVAVDHTFAVSTGSTEVLVHNAGNACKPSPTLSGGHTFNRGQRNFTLEQGTASAGWKHIYDRHIDPNRFTNKSKFDPSLTEADLIDLLGRVITHGKESTYAGNAVFEFRTNFNRTGYQTYRVTVLPDGTVQTFHPLG